MLVGVFVIGFLGLCLGSLVNAVVWRLHEQEKIDSSKRKDKKQAKKKYSIVTARSMCPHCKHELAPADLVPVFSWLALRGKCRYCKAPISVQYPLVELLVMIAALVSYITWPVGLDTGLGWTVFGTWLVLLTVLAVLAVYDIRYMLLPNRVVALATLSALGVIAGLAAEQNNVSILTGAIIGGATLAGLFGALFYASKGNWIGGGDVKIAFALGLLAGGFIEAVLLLFLASLFGMVQIAGKRLFGRQLITRKSQLPFGPWLIIATLVTFLWGSAILSWYFNLLAS